MGALGRAYNFNDLIRDARRINLRNKLREGILQRGLIQLLENFASQAVGDHFARLQNQQVSAQLLDYFEDVRTIKDEFALPRETAHQPPEYEGGGDVEAGQRLVENNDARVMQQPRDQQYFLPHSFRVGRQGGMALRVQRE